MVVPLPLAHRQSFFGCEFDSALLILNPSTFFYVQLCPVSDPESINIRRYLAPYIPLSLHCERALQLRHNCPFLGGDALHQHSDLTYSEVSFSLRRWRQRRARSRCCFINIHSEQSPCCFVVMDGVGNSCCVRVNPGWACAMQWNARLIIHVPGPAILVSRLTSPRRLVRYAVVVHTNCSG